MNIIIGNKIASKIEKKKKKKKKVISILTQINSYKTFNDAVIGMNLHLIQSPQLIYYSARVTMDYRLLLTYDTQKDTCLVVDLVSHKDFQKKSKHTGN